MFSYGFGFGPKRKRKVTRKQAHSVAAERHLLTLLSGVGGAWLKARRPLCDPLWRRWYGFGGRSSPPRGASGPCRDGLSARVAESRFIVAWNTCRNSRACKTPSGFRLVVSPVVVTLVADGVWISSSCCFVGSYFCCFVNALALLKAERILRCCFVVVFLMFILLCSTKILVKKKGIYKETCFYLKFSNFGQDYSRVHTAWVKRSHNITSRIRLDSPMKNVLQWH